MPPGGRCVFFPSRDRSLSPVDQGRERHARRRAISAPSVAIVHDYLTQRGGAERVVLSMARAFPEAPVYTSLYSPETTYPEFADVDVRPLWLQRLRPLRRHHRLAFPLLPLAFGADRLDYDVVLCSSSGWAHGVRTRGVKIVYCHSPARWLYLRNTHIAEDRPWHALALRAARVPLVAWDQRAAASATSYVVNSENVQRRVHEVYGTRAEVLHPPVRFPAEGPTTPVPVGGRFYLCVARLLRYKNVHQVVQAFEHLPNLELVVVGDGPEGDVLQRTAGPNVHLVGSVGDSELRWLYRNCAGLVSASYEDFGLTPVEAAIFGKPSVVLASGGYLETVVPGRTGIYFGAAEAGQIADAVRRAERQTWVPERIIEHATIFQEPYFMARLRALVAAQVGEVPAAARPRAEAGWVAAPSPDEPTPVVSPSWSR